VPVKAAGESQCGGISDDELHGDDRTDSAVYQLGGGTGEQIIGGCFAGLTGIKDDQPGNGPAGVKQASESRRRHQACPAGEFVLQREYSPVPVDTAMANEVQDMPAAVQQRLLQARPGSGGCPGQLDLLASSKVFYRVTQATLLLGHVELGQIAGSRDKAKDAQRRIDLQRGGWLGGLDIADDRFSLTEVLVGLRVEQGLPGQRCQLRRAQSQHKTQRLATTGRLLNAGGVPAIHSLGEY